MSRNRTSSIGTKKVGTTLVVTTFLVPLPATRSESVFSKILLILNNFKQLEMSFAIAQNRMKKRSIYEKKMVA